MPDNQQLSQDDKCQLLAMWQTCVEQANSVSQRRDTMNNWFLTLHVAVIGALLSFENAPTIVLCVVGLILCILWYKMIVNFKALNSAKYKVILEIERQLTYQPMMLEWNVVKSLGKYQKTTLLELGFPVLFGLCYLIISIISYVPKNLLSFQVQAHKTNEAMSILALNLDKNAIDWVFSTLPQALAVIVGLLLTGIVYFNTRLDSTNDETNETIHNDEKKHFWKWFLIISIFVGFVIATDIVILCLDNIVENSLWIWIPVLANIIAIGLCLYLSQKILNPNAFQDTINREKKTNVYFVAISPSKEEGVEEREYLETCKFLEQAIRAKCKDQGLEDSVGSKLRVNAEYLYKRNIIDRSELYLVETAIKTRNIMLHDENPNKVSKEFVQRLDLLKAKLLLNNSHR